MKSEFPRILRAQANGIMRVRSGRLLRSIGVVRVGAFEIGVTWIFYGDLVRAGRFKREAEKSFRHYLQQAVSRATIRYDVILRVDG